jgi:quinol monooxygenase YgiN
MNLIVLGALKFLDETMDRMRVHAHALLSHVAIRRACITHEIAKDLSSGVLRFLEVWSDRVTGYSHIFDAAIQMPITSVRQTTA